ncbi:MAG: hypothetical protein KDG89_17115 [Geminicoccaceae bacterium]|nr:hypothetical protein [Geminicoccaceae bacterium]
MSERARVRINLAQREVEIEGGEAFVEGFTARIEDLLARLGEAPSGSAAEDGLPLFQPHLTDPSATAAEDKEGLHPDMGPFGEYLHHMPSTSTEVDRMLASGFFLQQSATDQTFATGDANKRLAEHGIKIGNPSQCVRQSLMAKRVFMVSRGRYRVSQQGRTYLRQLMGSVIPA